MTTRVIRALPAMATVVAFAVAPLSAQQSIAIGATPTCAGCSISLTKLFELSNEFGDAGAQGTLAAIARDSRGIIYAVYHSAPYEIVVHDGATGRVLRKIGRQGQGPGEFQDISHLVVGPGDSLHAFDVRARRRVVLSPSGTFVRSVPQPASTIAAAIFADSRAVLWANIPSGTTITSGFHVIGADGRVERTFGGPAGGATGAPAPSALRFVSRATDSTFWASAYREYRIDLWDLTGRHLRTLTRQAPWFAPTTTYQPVSPDVPPQSTMHWHMHQDREGRLWVVLTVPDARWRSAVARNPTPGPESSGYRITDQRMYQDTIIEVIDPRTGQLLVSQRFDDLLWMPVDGLFAMSSGESSATEHLTLSRLDLVVPPR